MTDFDADRFVMGLSRPKRLPWARFIFEIMATAIAVFVLWAWSSP